MQKGLNKVLIIGNVGKDPALNYTEDSKLIAIVNIATTYSFKNKKTDQIQSQTEWHRVVFFNNLAQVVSDYVKKGSKLYIEGSLRTKKWQDKTGADKYTTEIVAAEMIMLGGKAESSDSELEHKEEEKPFKIAVDCRADSNSVRFGQEEDDDIPF